jgi:hypothetical protein
VWGRRLTGMAPDGQDLGSPYDGDRL